MKKRLLSLLLVLSLTLSMPQGNALAAVSGLLDNTVDGMESWIDMEGNPYFYGLSSHENVEIKLYNKANPLKPWKMMGRMHDKYFIADGKRYILGGRNTYNYFLGDFPGHKNYDRDVLVVCDEPEKENSVNQLLEYFETIWEQEDSGYFHDNKKDNRIWSFI